jgi:hypothetical protein
VSLYYTLYTNPSSTHCCFHMEHKLNTIKRD